MERLQRYVKGGRFRLPAALLIAAGLLLLAAAVSLGKGGPRTPNYQFAADSSGTGKPPPLKEPPPPVVVKPPPDITPPLVYISGSKALSGNGRAFTFSSSEGSTTFTCRLGAKPAVPCASPFKLPKLGSGRHVLTVTAVDAAGNASTAAYSFFVKKTKHAPSRRHRG